MCHGRDSSADYVEHHGETGCPPAGAGAGACLKEAMPLWEDHSGALTVLASSVKLFPRLDRDLQSFMYIYVNNMVGKCPKEFLL